MMLGEMALAENEVGVPVGTKQQQQHSSDIITTNIVINQYSPS